jgi:hypothetical protein
MSSLGALASESESVADYQQQPQPQPIAHSRQFCNRSVGPWLYVLFLSIGTSAHHDWHQGEPAIRDFRSYYYSIQVTPVLV